MNNYNTSETSLEMNQNDNKITHYKTHAHVKNLIFSLIFIFSLFVGLQYIILGITSSNEVLVNDYNISSGFGTISHGMDIKLWLNIATSTNILSLFMRVFLIMNISKLRMFTIFHFLLTVFQFCWVIYGFVNTCKNINPVKCSIMLLYSTPFITLLVIVIQMGSLLKRGN